MFVSRTIACGFGLLMISIIACSPAKDIQWPKRRSNLGATTFFEQAASLNWKQRDSLAWQEFEQGNIPPFLQKFSRIKVSHLDSASGKTFQATYFVAPDYFAIGTPDDWARLPITPMTAQKIADRLDCFLPTRKMVDDIYRSSRVKLNPVPMYAFRDSTPTFRHHHLIIEGQRKGRKGLISGIKKDVIISPKMNGGSRPNRVVIYGWHKLDGRPIQPAYAGHVNWYVDYSHGIRLVYRKIKVGNRWMDYEQVLNDPVLKKLLCDEPECNVFRY